MRKNNTKKTTWKNRFARFRSELLSGLQSFASCCQAATFIFYIFEGEISRRMSVDMTTLIDSNSLSKSSFLSNVSVCFRHYPATPLSSNTG